MPRAASSSTRLPSSSRLPRAMISGVSGPDDASSGEAGCGGDSGKGGNRIFEALTGKKGKTVQAAPSGASGTNPLFRPGKAAFPVVSCRSGEDGPDTHVVMTAKNINHNIDNLKQWIADNQDRLIEYAEAPTIGHDAIDNASVIENIIAGIESGKLSAIEIGTDFVLADFKSPFGKILKCKIYNSLRRQAGHIDSARRSKLAGLAVKGIGMPYPPRELKALLKLIKAFGPSCCQAVITSAAPQSAVGNRHVSYLRDRP